MPTEPRNSQPAHLPANLKAMQLLSKLAHEAFPTVPASEYMEYLKYKLGHAWHPPRHLIPARQTQVAFKIYKDGHISDLKILQSSGISGDEAAKNAVKAAIPFEPPPLENKEFIDIQFTFGPYLLPKSRRGIILNF